jgi:PST family polysaccharide transporter
LFGAQGAGWAHLAVGILLVFPAYLLAVHRCGADVRAVIASLWPPVLAVLPAAFAARATSAAINSPVAALLVGGSVGVTIYVVCILRWFLARVPRRDAVAAGRPRPKRRGARPKSTLTTTSQP